MCLYQVIYLYVAKFIAALLRTSQPQTFSIVTRNMSSNSNEKYKFETLRVWQPHENVTQVELNRPKKLNAMNSAFWRYIGFNILLDCIYKLSNIM